MGPGTTSHSLRESAPAAHHRVNHRSKERGHATLRQAAAGAVPALVARGSVGASPGRAGMAPAGAGGHPRAGGRCLLGPGSGAGAAARRRRGRRRSSVTATEGATSAENLGARRSGSGVGIGPDGLILTDRLPAARGRDHRGHHPGRPHPAGAPGRLRPGDRLRRWCDPGAAAGHRAGAPGRGVAGLSARRAPAGRHRRQQRHRGGVHAPGGDPRPFSRLLGVPHRVALFTSPPIPNHSGAPLFNRNGELVGIGSLLVLRGGVGQKQRHPGQHVRAGRAAAAGAGRDAVHRPNPGQHPALARASRPSERDGHVQIVRVDRQGPALRRPASSRGTWCWRWTASGWRRSRLSTSSSGPRPDA